MSNSYPYCLLEATATHDLCCPRDLNLGHGWLDQGRALIGVNLFSPPLHGTFQAVATASCNGCSSFGHWRNQGNLALGSHWERGWCRHAGRKALHPWIRGAAWWCLEGPSAPKPSTPEGVGPVQGGSALSVSAGWQWTWKWQESLIQHWTWNTDVRLSLRSPHLWTDRS